MNSFISFFLMKRSKVFSEEIGCRQEYLPSNLELYEVYSNQKGFQNYGPRGKPLLKKKQGIRLNTSCAVSRDNNQGGN